MKFQVYKDAKSEFRGRLLAANGKIIADSGEGYVSKQSCLNGINLVKQNAAAAPLEDQTVAAAAYSGYRNW